VTTETLEYLARSLVSNPDEVSVTRYETDDGETLELAVHPDDVGKVIGKRGRTAKAVRTMVATAAGRKGTSTTVNILD